MSDRRIFATLGGHLADGAAWAVNQPLAATQRLLAAAIAVSTALVSAHFLPELGKRALPSSLAWTLFMTTEAFAALGLITWRTGRTRAHRWAGALAATLALVGSVAAMVTAHVTRVLPPGVTSGWDIGVAVIAVYPIVFVGAIHLLLAGRDEPRGEDEDRARRDGTGAPTTGRGATKTAGRGPTGAARTRAAAEPRPTDGVATPGASSPRPTPTVSLVKPPAVDLTKRPAPPAATRADAAGRAEADALQAAQAAALGVHYDPPVDGEDGPARRQRLSRNRSRLARARSRTPEPVDA